MIVVNITITINSRISLVNDSHVFVIAIDRELAIKIPIIQYLLLRAMFIFSARSAGLEPTTDVYLLKVLIDYRLTLKFCQLIMRLGQRGTI